MSGRKPSSLFSLRGVAGMLIAVFALFVAFELGIRLYALAMNRLHPGKPSVSPATVTSIYYPEHDIAFHAPNQDFVDTSIPSRSYRVRINSHGFRGKEIAKRKPENTTRLAALGDSFVYGMGVSDEETLSSRMESLLKKKSGGANCEAINAGQSGFYLDIEIQLFRNYVKDFQPDIVILAYTYNDIPESFYFKNYERALRVERLKSAKTRRLATLAVRARSLSFFNFLMRKKAEWIVDREFQNLKGADRIFLKLKKMEMLDKGRWRLYEHLVENYKTKLLNFHGELKKDGFEFLFVIFPTNLDDSEIKRPLNAELFEFAVENGIPAIDLREAWLSRNPDIRHFFDDYEHPTPEAFEISAKEIILKLQEENML